MSILRIIGLLTGIILLIFAFYIFRGPKWKKSNFILVGVFSLFLIIISLNPNTINSLASILSLNSESHPRLISLLLLSSFLSWFFYFELRIKFDKNIYQFDTLIRNLSSEELSAENFQKLKNKNVLVMIPAYNESKNLSSLKQKIDKTALSDEIEIVLIDDGSKDNTYKTARDLGFCVIRSKINRGQGAALRIGYDIAKKTNAKIIITMDADGQHDPSEITRLIEPIKNNNFDFVIGSRILGDREKDSSVRIIGVHFFNKIINLLLKTNISDCSSGFRAFKTELIQRLILREDQYNASELIISAIKSGAKVKEVPITVYKREHGQSKKGKNLIYGFNFAKTIIKTWWR